MSFQKLRVVFAGTPDFAATALDALLRAGHAIPLVLTQPDRPSGRGLKLQPSPVKRMAVEQGIEVMQPLTLRPEHKTHGAEGMAAQQVLRTVFGAGARADVMVVAAYGLLLPQAVLDMPVRGCINIHASLLPRWRGAAPIHRAIEAGDVETGITIMRMDAGLDTGPMLLKRSIPIGPTDTTGALERKLAALGGEAIVAALDRLEELQPIPQPAHGATYANKIEKREAGLDFDLSAASVVCKILAFNPAPGATTQLSSGAGETIKLWQAAVVDESGVPGRVLRSGPEGIVIACGDGRSVIVTELQRPGGKRLSAREFLAGMPMVVGTQFAPSSAP